MTTGPEPVQAELVRTRPGLEAALGDPDSVWLVDEFLRTPGIESSALAAELSSVDTDTGGLLSSRLGRAAEVIADLFTGRKRTLVGREQARIPVRAMVIQCPVGVSSGVSMTVENVESSTSALRAEFASIGGGPRHEVSFTVRDRYELQVPDSSAYIVYSVAGVWERWEVETRSGEILSYPKLASVDPSQASLSSADGPDRPPDGWGTSGRTTEIDLRANVSGSRTLRTEYGEEFDVTAGINVFGSGVKLSAKTRREYATSATYQFETGRRYVAEYFESVGAWWVSASGV